MSLKSLKQTVSDWYDGRKGRVPPDDLVEDLRELREHVDILIEDLTGEEYVSCEDY